MIKKKVGLIIVLLFFILFMFFSIIQMNNYKENIDLLEKYLNEITKTNKQLIDKNEYLEKRNNDFIKSIENLNNQIKELENKNKDLEKKLQAKNNSSLKKSYYYISNNKKEKIAYLTFDDGPSMNTMSILNTLDKYGVKATFFVNGNNSSFGENTYKRIVESGHVLANHTYSHNYSHIYSSVDNFKGDFIKLEELIKLKTGITTNVFRFPGGSNNNVSKKYGGKYIMLEIQRQMIKDGYVYFDWNVDSRDATRVVETKEEIVKNVLEQSKNKKNAIILMHDSHPKTTTAKALPEIIEGLKKMGFKFETISKDSYVVQFQRPLIINY